MRRRRTFRRPSPRAGGRLPTSMPRPPSYQKVNPAEQPVLYLALDSEHPAAVHRERVCRHPAGAAHLDGQRRVARAGVRRAEVRRAGAGGSRQAGGARTSASMKCSTPLRRSNTNLPTGRLDGDRQAFTIQSSGTLGNAAAYRPIIVAWRNGIAGAAGRTGQRDRQRGERQARGLVQQLRTRAFWPSSGSRAPTRWKWWTAS